MLMVGVAISIMDLQVCSGLDLMSPKTWMEMGFALLTDTRNATSWQSGSNLTVLHLGVGRSTATRKGKANERQHMGNPYAPAVLGSLYQLNQPED